MAKGASARAAARKQKDKWKAKRWFTIRAPRNPWSFRVIGETLAEDDEFLIGRSYEIMQNELDGDFSKMHVKIQFRVIDVVSGDALTEFVGHEHLKDQIRRQVRRDRGKIDDTVDVVTEDGYYVRFKPLIITRGRVKSSQKQEMRTIARDAILTTGASMTWLTLQKAVLDGSIENTIKESVSKIQPVRTVIIRRTQLLQSGVLVEDGPTLDEIHTQESADAEEAKIRDATDTEEDADEADEDTGDVSDEIIEDSVESELEEESDSIDYSSMKVTELKVLLKSQGKPVSGKKSDLIDRLNE